MTFARICVRCVWLVWQAVANTVIAVGGIWLILLLVRSVNALTD